MKIQIYQTSHQLTGDLIDISVFSIGFNILHSSRFKYINLSNAMKQKQVTSKLTECFFCETIFRVEKKGKQLASAVVACLVFIEFDWLIIC